MENLPGYISITFILTTFLTIGFLFYAIKQSVLDSLPAKIVVSAIAFWLFFTAILAIGGFYQNTSGLPPRFTFIALPSFIFIAFLFIFFNRNFINELPIKLLTLLHIVRIPVEIVLWWLYEYGMIPKIMTFEDRNFDILMGITAPIIYWLAFKNDKINRTLLIIWNCLGLILLSNIVATAILSLPSDFQQFGLTQANRAVLFFPYVWLPALVVPIVYFAHFASLWQLFKKYK